MRTIEYTPGPCKPNEAGEAPKFTGKITLKAANSNKRMQLMEEMLKLSLDIKDDKDNEKSPALGNVRMVRKMIDVVSTMYEAVDIQSVDGKQYKSYEDLDYDSSAMPILVDVATYMFNVIQGNSLSKN